MSQSLRLHFGWKWAIKLSFLAQWQFLYHINQFSGTLVDFSTWYNKPGSPNLDQRCKIPWLTHLPLVKMAAISQSIFSDAFLWMKSFVFLLKFHWNLFLRVQLTIVPSIVSDNGLVPNRRQAIIWTNADPVHWRIYVALGGDKLRSLLFWRAIDLNIQSQIYYASAFRRRRHYVFGLSIRPSIQSLKYPLLTCTWVRWSTRPTVTVLWHVRPSVPLSIRPGRFLGICRRMHGGIGLKFYMLMYLDHLQDWLVYGRGLLIFLILKLFWLSEMGQIWGFRAFPGECMEGMAWNFACWCILITFRTD